MQIKIEVDVRPDELRRFVGLPDVAGLQDDVIHFVREKLAQASESFDASAFVKNNLSYLSRNPLVMRLLAAAKHKPSAEGAEAPLSEDVMPATADADATKPKSKRSRRKRRGAAAPAKRARKRASRRTSAK
jgi:hypothetical protein